MKGQEDLEEDISSYWMKLRKQKVTGNGKRKHYSYIALPGELAVEEAVNLSSDRLRGDGGERKGGLFQFPYRSVP